MAEKLEKQQTRSAAKQKRFDQDWSEPNFAPFKQEPVHIVAERDTQPSLIERQLQKPEIQRIHAEQERLRIEAEQLWLDQERHFAEQARLRSETESDCRLRHEAEIQPPVLQQRPSKSEKQLLKETNDKIENPLPIELPDVVIQAPPLEGAFLNISEQNVSTGILLKETANLPFNPPANNKISWLLPVSVLVFLMFGGAILGMWFLQPSKKEELNQTNPDKIESNQTNQGQIQSRHVDSNQILSSGSTSNFSPAVNSNPEINEIPPSLTVNSVTTEITKRSFHSKPTARKVKKRTPQSPRSSKPPSEPKRTITIDDILNDQ